MSKFNVILTFLKWTFYLGLDLICALAFNIGLALIIFAVLVSLPLMFTVSLCCEVFIKYLGYFDRVKYRITEYKGEKRTHHVKQVMKRYLQIECSHESEVPPHLVTAFLHLSSATVYEVDRKTQTVSRFFKFDNRRNQIEVCNTSRPKVKIWSSIISDIDEDRKVYVNFLPEGLTLPED